MYFNDYRYYSETYGSGVVPTAEDFAKIIREANAVVDDLTHKNITDVTDEVKNAICAVCDELYKRDNEQNITSESVGNHSVSYGAALSLGERNARARQMATLYLSGTGLLYRGFSS